MAQQAYNTNSMYVDVISDASGVTNLTNTVNANGYVDTNLVSEHTLFSYTWNTQVVLEIILG